jgi:hypothetical protein
MKEKGQKMWNIHEEKLLENEVHLQEKGQKNVEYE